MCKAVFNVGRVQGRIQDFKLGVGAFKKIAPSGGRREHFGLFRVKNHDFTPKNHIFPILGSAPGVSLFKHVIHYDPRSEFPYYNLTTPHREGPPYAHTGDALRSSVVFVPWEPLPVPIINTYFSIRKDEMSIDFPDCSVRPREEY